MDPAKKYPVLCAWCEKEGVMTRVNWSTVAHSHGICERHQAEVRREIAMIKERWGNEDMSGLQGL